VQSFVVVTHDDAGIRAAGEVTAMNRRLTLNHDGNFHVIDNHFNNIKTITYKSQLKNNRIDATH
jgi:hypothetical protein